jgi:amidophosphoribosyltransferase
MTHRLQHRGREAAGIALIGENRIDVIKWVGEVGRFDLEDLYKLFPVHLYHTFLGHVRYATRGRKDKILEDAHPHVIGGETHHRGDHVMILDCDAVIVHNGQVNEEYLRDVDRSRLTTGCDSEALLHLYRKILEYEFMRRVPGAYTLAIADKHRKDVVVMRDRTGIRPGVLGWKDGKKIMASEDIALRRSGAKVIEDLDPGSVYFLSPDGDYRREKVVESALAYCFFEYNYIAHMDSVLNGVPVRRVREALGEMCAAEHPMRDADFVTYVPRCPQLAARRYAEVLGLPFADNVFYKMRGERSFQGSTREDRRDSIRHNLHLAPNGSVWLRGKKLVNVDDSTVRANIASRLVQLMAEAEVGRATLVNYTPPIGIIGADGVRRGCTSGVDMPPDDNFIARGRTVEEISAAVGIDMRYLSIEGMLAAYESAGVKKDSICTYCIGGSDPFAK